MPSFSETQIIKLKDKNWFDRQKIAGQCVATCLKTSKEIIESHKPAISLKYIEAVCLEIIKSMNCSPTFLGYKGFPGAICASVNTQLVHGIPTDYVLQDGDVVKIDLGATYQGAIGDAAITAIYGAPKHPEHPKLIQACKLALDNAIKMVAVGKRLGVIGSAIHYINRSTRYGLITNYGGHGIDEDTPHAQPFVANKAQSLSGVRLQPGMTLAIEPMMVIGEAKTRTESDGWTVVTPGIGAHFEHTIFIAEDKVHVMTDYENL
ncbi:MAG TPA: type I methionyl aminopeptidase [Anaerovoracaceae bacterium]|nr:type I methionyl aminopeptidase [Anaerovoracaceae bacterium]